MKVWHRLWVRLTLAFTLVILVAVGAVAVLIRQTTDIEFRQYITHSGARASGTGIQKLAAYYQQNGSWDGVESLLGEGIFINGPAMMSMPGMERRPGMPGMLGRRLDLLLADADGKVVFDSAGKATGQKLSSREQSRALPITALDDDNQVIGHLLLALPDRRDGLLGSLEQRFLDRMRGVLIAGAAVAVSLGLVASALLSRSLTAPLQRLAEAARAVAGGDLSQQVKVEGGAEVAKVSQAFNEMTSALEEGERLRQNLVADVAHELRTPLSVLQGNLRALLDDVYLLEKAEIARLYDETRLLSRLVDDLRELAQAEAGQLSFNLRPTDVGEVLQATVANFEPAAEAKAIQLAAEVADRLPLVTADPDRLAQVLRNLLINALRHTPEGGQVTVSATTVGDAVEIVVADNGEGIAPEDLPHVFDRFYRGDRSRSRAEGGAGLALRPGSGLGLAIVRAIVEAHGGQVRAASDGLGQGSTFRFTLPVA
jgi:two-component system OmpR family sensor kinase/two-component system sensor histidine kinase BaeS